jgi:vacuolar-type H+-ATPase subunit F/Vma7
VSRIAAIGESELVDGYGLAGVEVLPAPDAAAARRAWASLEDDVGLLLLTPAAEAALAAKLAEARGVIWAVIPE